jgi:hypothetical protein
VADSSSNVTDWPWGAGGPQSGFSTSGMYQGTFAKKIGSAPRPPGGPPVLGSLVRSAEGLPSTCAIGPSGGPCHTHQPAPGDTQGNVSRQLARAVVLGGGAAPAPTRGAWGASAIRVAKKNARCPGPPGLLRKAWPGWPSYVRGCPRAGQEEEQNTS